MSNGEKESSIEGIGPEEERVLSDSELIKGGARFVETEQGKSLILVPEQVEQIYKDFNKGALDEFTRTIEGHGIFVIPPEAFSILEKISPEFAKSEAVPEYPKWVSGIAVKEEYDPENNEYSSLIWYPAQGRVDAISFGLYGIGQMSFGVGSYRKSERGDWIRGDRVYGRIPDFIGSQMISKKRRKE